MGMKPRAMGNIRQKVYSSGRGKPIYGEALLNNGYRRNEFHKIERQQQSKMEASQIVFVCKCKPW
jgi:hypothetical protein